MKLFLHFLIIFAIFNISAACAENFFNEIKKDFQTDEAAKAIEHFQNAYQKQNSASATERAEYYYQSDIDLRPQGCADCPEYLKLIREVNSIVEKLPEPKEIAKANEQKIQIDRLKFMYVESVSASMGNEFCSVLHNSDPLMTKGVDKEKLSLVFEELTTLPNVTSVQYYPMPPEKERRYFYRGEGMQSHIIIEVIVKSDQTALVRYHHYDPYDLPNLGSKVSERSLFDAFEGQGRLTDNLSVNSRAQMDLSQQNVRLGVAGDSGREWIQLEGKHETQSNARVKAIIPMEIDLSEDSKWKLSGQVSHEQKKDLVSSEHAKSNRVAVKVSDNEKSFVSGEIEQKDRTKEVKIGTGYQMSLGDTVLLDANAAQVEKSQEDKNSRNQNLSVSLKDTKGNHEFVTANVSRDQKNNLSQEKISVGTKHQVELDKENGLKVSGAAIGSTMVADNSDAPIRTNELILSLTDHNHEYVTAKVVKGNALNDLMSLSSAYKVGDYGNVKGTYETYESGREAVSFGHQMKSGKNSFETSVGRDSEAGNYFSFKMERKISSTSSMVLTVKTDTNNDKTIMYQYQAKF